MELPGRCGDWLTPPPSPPRAPRLDTTRRARGGDFQLAKTGDLNWPPVGTFSWPRTTSKLVNELVEAADDKQLSKTIARYGRVDLLCLDELGFLELDRKGAELFQVLTEREEKSAVAIASNEAFSGWTKTFTDPRLCAAIVDRLTFNGQIIETGTTSYRLEHARAARTNPAT